ncbi:MAG: methionine synthase [Desulfitobacteriaceae bacterium]|nr:methionine synthase [Clostridia bacterium]MDD4346300.1 methionine synthase [Desulfitobacteriaceae bacterium]MDD4400748.1 methionine synthase [Desulfitobacteriaceae bacterium]
MLNTKYFKPQFLVTGVGSLPHNNVSEALEMIWRSAPLAPYWPQLPGSGAESSFIGQYLRALIKTGVIDSYQTPRFQADLPDWPERLADFYELYLLANDGDDTALAEFGFSSEGGAGLEGFCRDIEQKGTRGAVLLKGQLSGPLSLGLQITDKDRRASYYDEVQRDTLVRSLAMHARWQTRRLSAYGLPVLISIDDPGFYAYGASTHITLDREQILADLNSIVEGITSEGGIPGVHVCAGTDWTIMFDSQIQVVNFDAYEYLTSMLVLAEPLNNYLQRGGVLSWGIIPTNNQVMTEDLTSLKQRLEDNIAALVKRGVDENLLRQQSMLTPSCGLGSLTLEISRHIAEIMQQFGPIHEKKLPVFR